MRRGFSLVELLIVVCVLTLLLMLAIPHFNRYTKETQIVRVNQDIETLFLACHRFQQLDGRLPLSMGQLLGRYLSSIDPDPWGNEYILSFGYVICAGEDGEYGTEDDIKKPMKSFRDKEDETAYTATQIGKYASQYEETKNTILPDLNTLSAYVGQNSYDKKIPRDPYDKEYQIDSNEGTIVSGGEDRTIGTGDDIVSPFREYLLSENFSGDLSKFQLGCAHGDASHKPVIDPALKAVVTKGNCAVPEAISKPIPIPKTKNLVLEAKVSFDVDAPCIQAMTFGFLTNPRPVGTNGSNVPIGWHIVMSPGQSFPSSDWMAPAAPPGTFPGGVGAVGQKVQVESGVHAVKVVIRVDKKVEFYLDGQLVQTSQNAISTGSSDPPFVIQARTDNPSATNKFWIDDVRIRAVK